MIRMRWKSKPWPTKLNPIYLFSTLINIRCQLSEVNKSVPLPDLIHGPGDVRRQSRVGQRDPTRERIGARFDDLRYPNVRTRLQVAAQRLR